MASLSSKFTFNRCINDDIIVIIIIIIIIIIQII